MKTTTFLSLFVLLLFLPLALLAQTPARSYEIRLKNRKFTPAPAMADNLPGQSRSGPGRYLLLQFSTLPAAEELAAKGIKSLNYVPDNAILAYVPKEADLKSLPQLRWAGPLKAADKINARRLNDSPDASARTDGSSTRLVEAFWNVNRKEVEALVRRAGGTLVANPALPPHVVMATGDPGVFAQLAEAEQVAWITEAPEALAGDQTRTYCPGPMTQYGAFAEFATVGQGWEGSGQNCVNLTYFFANGTPDIAFSDERSAVRRGILEWARYTPGLRFSETGSAGRNRSFDIRWASGAHGDGNPFDGPSGVLAHAYYPAAPNPETIAGDMHFDEAETWSLTTNIHLFSVALHEAGHALGLGHSDDPGAIMYAYYGGAVTGLRADDIAGIQSLYAPFAANFALNTYGYTAGGWRVENHPRMMADVNGDNRDDIVAFGNAGAYVSFSTGTGFTAPSLKVNNYGYTAGGWRVNMHPRMMADVNGDNRDDIVGFGDAGVFVSFSTGTGFTAPSLKVSSYGYVAGGWRVEQHPRMMADVNGDNRADIVGFANNGVYVSFSTGTGFTAPSLKVNNYGYTAGGWRVSMHPRMMADVNGDRRADIVGFGDAGAYVSFSTGTGFTAPSLKVNNYGYVAGGWRVSMHPRMMADVNGDNRDDIVGFGDAGAFISYATSTGGFTAPSLKSPGFGYVAGGWRVESHPRFVADMNGDNRDDIVGFANDGVYVSYSKGTTQTPAVRISNNFGYYASAGGWRVSMHPRLLADVNGDRRADIVGFGFDGVFLNNGSPCAATTIIAANTEAAEAVQSAEAVQQAEAARPTALSDTEMGEMLVCAPNPFGGQARVEYQVAEAGRVNLSLYDLTGNRVVELVNAPNHPAGKHATTLDAARLRNGIYFLRLAAGGKVITKKVVSAK
jgi:hypothetical protein